MEILKKGMMKKNLAINCILICANLMNQIQGFTWFGHIARMEQHKDYCIITSVLTACSQLSKNTDIFLSHLKWENGNWENYEIRNTISYT
jgi:hypothetical protein